jgi:hypothetical protein
MFTIKSIQLGYIFAYRIWDIKANRPVSPLFAELAQAERELAILEL